MLSCWQESSSQRPNFNALKLKFNDILTSHGENAYVDFCIDPNQPCYKTEITDVPPAYKNLLHSSVGSVRRSKIVSSEEFPDNVPISKASASPQKKLGLEKSLASPAAAAKSPVVGKLSFGQIQQPSKQDWDHRPRSMVMIKHNQDYKEDPRSSRQLAGGGEEDRYVKDPSALLNIPQLLTGSQQSSEEKKVVEAMAD